MLTKEQEKKLRDSIFEMTGYDIDKAVTASGSRNTSYIISESTKPVAIRLSPGNEGSKAWIASEILFADYLKEFIPTICQAVPFQNSLVNTISCGEESYDMVVFRKGNGCPESDCRKEEYIQAAGVLLGKLHRASILANEEGFRYKRKPWDEMSYFQLDKEKILRVANEDTYKAFVSVLQEVKSIPKDQGSYGMIHGDFSSHNMFMDWDNLWLFDFDDCCYAFYMMDLCTVFAEVYLWFAQMQSLTEFPDYIRRFRAVYERENTLDSIWWSEERLRLFTKLRFISNCNILMQSVPEDSPKYAFLPMLLEVFHSIDTQPFFKSGKKEDAK